MDKGVLMIDMILVCLFFDFELEVVLVFVGD